MKNKLTEAVLYKNPVFVLLLGLCPVLAITTTFENSLIMGLSAMFVLVCSNLLISLIKNFIDDDIKIPAYILIIATFVTIVELFLRSYLPVIYQTLGIYIPLIVVNCLIMGRAVAYASKNKVHLTIIDSISYGIGFTLAIVILGTFREILGTGSITIMNNLSRLTGYQMVYNILPDSTLFPLNILVSPAGSFLSLAFVVAGFNYYKNLKEAKKWIYLFHQ